jgi:anti-anti-sigma factor
MTLPPQLLVTIEQDGSGVVLRLTGEVDVSNADSLREIINDTLDRGPQSLVMDLAALTFADCGSLSVLAPAHDRLAAQGGELVILNAQPIIRRLLAITGLDAYVVLKTSKIPEGGPESKEPGASPAPAGPA